MKDLIELFFSAPSNTFQEAYREYEAQLISGEESPEYCRMRMTEQLESWIDSQIEKYDMDVSIFKNSFTLGYGDCDIDFTDASKLVVIIEACQKDDLPTVKETINQL